MSPVTFAMEPIGVVRSPFLERLAAPRQATVAEAAEALGRVELFAGHGYEDALDGLARWKLVWLIFVFHQNVAQGRGWKPKVLPPRSNEKQGVFATRSPHRPNPIGLTATRIERVEGLVVHVRGLDVLDGTPVLDLKPYVAYADCHPDAGTGWLGPHDPVSSWKVTFAHSALQALAWLKERGVDLATAIESSLALGPQPHPYRRIRPNRGAAGSLGAMTLALREWRADFDVQPESRSIVVCRIRTGHRARDIALDPRLELHKSFAATFE